MSLQAGTRLKELLKQDCAEYVKIISTAVEEVCRGLQCDNDPDGRQLWHQKIHALLFYNLVRKKYLLRKVGSYWFFYDQTAVFKNNCVCLALSFTYCLAGYTCMSLVGVCYVNGD